MRQREVKVAMGKHYLSADLKIGRLSWITRGPQNHHGDFSKGKKVTREMAEGGGLDLSSPALRIKGGGMRAASGSCQRHETRLSHCFWKGRSPADL